MSDIENSAADAERKTSEPAQLAFFVAVASVVVVGVAWLLNEVVFPEEEGWLTTAAGIYIGFAGLWVVVVIPAVCLLSVISLIVVVVNHKKVKGIWQALGSVAICIAVVTMLVLAFRAFSFEHFCGEHLRGIHKDMGFYAAEHDHCFPPADRWCDLVIEFGELVPGALVCPDSDAEYGECSYAINTNVAEKDWRKVPDDTVLLFETDYGKGEGGRDGRVSDRKFYADLGWDKDLPAGSAKVYSKRWNQSGGPEIATSKNHGGDGTMVVFCNGKVEFARGDRIHELRWTVEEPNE